MCDGTVDCQENGHDEQDCDGFRTHNLKNTYEKEGNLTTGKGKGSIHKLPRTKGVSLGIMPVHKA